MWHVQIDMIAISPIAKNGDLFAHDLHTWLQQASCSPSSPARPGPQVDLLLGLGKLALPLLHTTRVDSRPLTCYLYTSDNTTMRFHLHAVLHSMLVVIHACYLLYTNLPYISIMKDRAHTTHGASSTKNRTCLHLLSVVSNRDDAI